MGIHRKLWQLKMHLFSYNYVCTILALLNASDFYELQQTLNFIKTCVSLVPWWPRGQGTSQDTQHTQFASWEIISFKKHATCPETQMSQMIRLVNKRKIQIYVVLFARRKCSHLLFPLIRRR